MNNLITKVSKASKEFLDSDDNFLLIGLTGRTGSGCSTSANILKSQELELPDSGLTHYKGNELRKYRIVKRFIDKHWSPFEVLQVRNIITRYILDLKFVEFKLFVSNTLSESSSYISESLDFFRDEYDAMHGHLINLKALQENNDEEENHKKLEMYKFYYNDLPTFSNKVRDALLKVSRSAYVSIYQIAGDNVRASGRVDDKAFNPERFLDFADKINKVVKCARHVAKIQKKRCHIVIDAIRNPYEAFFFKDRYANFYLISVNTGNENRLHHLKSSRLCCTNQGLRPSGRMTA